MREHVCPWWLAYSFDNPVRRLIHDPARLLGPLVRPGMTALDVGCGMGHFTLGLARLVGEAGAVIAVDLQEEMLAKTEARARRAGLAGRIRLRRCTPEALGLTDRVDFAVASWMVHEVPDPVRFFGELRALLTDGGRILVAEPRLHVGGRAFEREVAAAREVGLVPCGAPPVALSRSVLLGVGGASRSG